MPRLPDIPQFPEADSPEERRALEHKAAEEAMESDHQAFAGSARHVGGVEFDDPGVYEIGDPEVDPDTLGAYAEPARPTGAPGEPRRRRSVMTRKQAEDREPDRPSLRREWKGDRTGEGPDELYNPTEVTSSRMRQQGLGMGEEELRLQRDPAREYHVREDMPGGEPPPPAPRRRPDKRH